MRLTAFLLLLLPIVSASAAPRLKLPEKVEAEPGVIEIAADTDSKEVGWQIMDKGISMISPDRLVDSKVLVLVALKPGTYRIVAAINGEPKPLLAMTTVIVGDGGSPAPPPTPVNPDADLLGKLQAVYGADGDPAKAVHLANLKSMYKQMSNNVPNVATWGDLYKVMDDTMIAVEAKGKLLPLQELLASSILTKELPSGAGAKTTPLDGDGKTKAKEVFARVNKLLEQLR